jgi:hypothetical protein
LSAQGCEVYPAKCGEVARVDFEPNTVERYEIPIKVGAGVAGTGPSLRAFSSTSAIKCAISATPQRMSNPTVQFFKSWRDGAIASGMPLLASAFIPRDVDVKTGSLVQTMHVAVVDPDFRRIFQPRVLADCPKDECVPQFVCTDPRLVFFEGQCIPPEKCLEVLPPVIDASTVSYAVGAVRPGDTVKLTLRRGEANRMLSFRAEAPPATPARTATSSSPPDATSMPRPSSVTHRAMVVVRNALAA